MIEKSNKVVFVLHKICHSGFHIASFKLLGVWRSKEEMLAFAEQEKRADETKDMKVFRSLGISSVEYRWDEERIR
jgi:hypothetical protein